MSESANTLAYCKSYKGKKVYNLGQMCETLVDQNGLVQ
jgi:hypothetical protein